MNKSEMPRPLGDFKFDAPLFVAGYLAAKDS